MKTIQKYFLHGLIVSFQDDQQPRTAEHSYLIEQIDYPFINECDHPLQQHVQYASSMGGTSSDMNPVQRYVPAAHVNDPRNDFGKLKIIII